MKKVYINFDNVEIVFFFKNKDIYQKIFPVLTNKKTIKRIKEKINNIGSGKYSLRLLRWRRFRGNPSYLVPEANHCVGYNWNIAVMDFFVTEQNTNEQICIIEIPYVWAFDGINKYTTLKFLEDEIENAESYGKLYKKLYKIFHLVKKYNAFCANLLGLTHRCK